MFNRFTKDARAIVVRAEEEARSLGSPTIEAEHLLLAFTASTPPPPGLVETDLTHEALLEAIRSDFESSLRAVGVSEESFAGAPVQRSTRKLRLGASFKSALKSAVATATSNGDRSIGARYVALGVLSAKRGTVPRALRSAGFEPEDLRTKV